MKITKRQLRQIIREEYSKLRRGDFINEMNRGQKRQMANMRFIGEEGTLGRKLNLSQPIPDFMVNQIGDELMKANVFDEMDGYYLLADIGLLEKHQSWCRANDVPCSDMLNRDDVNKLMQHFGL